MKVLLADDEYLIREGLRDNVPWAAHGMEVIATAEDGEQALELARQYRPDLLITDICMPFMDGLELVENVLREQADICVILLTCYDEFEYARQAMRYNVMEYLLKPASNEELYVAVGRALQKLKEELKQAAEKEAIQAQWERSRPLLKERLLQQWIMNGRKPDREDEELIWEGKQPGRFASLLLFRIDAWDPLYEKQEMKYRLVVWNLIREILLKGREYPLFENPDGDILAVVGEDSVEQVLEALDHQLGLLNFPLFQLFPQGAVDGMVGFLHLRGEIQAEFPAGVEEGVLLRLLKVQKGAVGVEQ